MGAGQSQRLFSYPRFLSARTHLASCEGTCLVWAVPFHNLLPGKCSHGQSCCISPCPNAPGVSLDRVGSSNSPNSRPLLPQASRCWGGPSCRMGHPPPARCSQTRLPSTPRTSRSPLPSLAPPASPGLSGPLCPLPRGRNLGRQRPPALGGSPRPRGDHLSCPHRQGMRQPSPPLNDQPAIATRTPSPSARGRKATGRRPGPPRGDAEGWSLAPGMWLRE